MKRIDLMRHLRRHRCVLAREGGKHTIMLNPDTHRSSSVPRHTEIVDVLARKICKDLGIPSCG